MNPNFSSPNAANINNINLSADMEIPRSTGMHSSINPQLRPRMEQPHFTGNIESYNNQPNHQRLQNNLLHNQRMQQNHPQSHPNLIQQRSQQNLRFPPSENLLKSQTAAYDSNNFQPKGSEVPFNSQRVQMTPLIKLPNPQQSIQQSYNNKNIEIPLNQSNLPSQSLKLEPSKTLIDSPKSNQNVNSEHCKTEIYNNSSSNFTSSTPSNLKSNTFSIISPEQTSRGGAKTFCSDVQPEIITNNERKYDSINEKTSLLPKEESKTESEQSVEISERKNYDSKRSEKIPKNDNEIKKKNFKEDNGITSGMVQRNIKFFEQNDTAKKPLRPKTISAERKETVAKLSSDIDKNDFFKNKFESGVDETPVVHPNLGSIFQIPRKVAKISIFKKKKSPVKFKSKRYFAESSNKKYVYGKPIFNQHSRSNKTAIKKTCNPEEELLSFFKNTKSWRKLCHYGSKITENSTNSKVVYKPTTNGDIPTPKKTPSKLQTLTKKNPPASPVKTPLKSPGTPGTKSLPKTPESPAPSTPLIKKVPMNKIQVGAAPSPNLKTIRSKVGSLANTTHKPGGGNIRIESHKIDLSNVQPRTEAKNDQYKPSGGDKKIQQVKLQWSAKSKVGSLENATYKPGGGDKKIESVKLDFKEKAKSKVGSKENVKHVPGGGNVKIENQKLEFRAQSKVGSLDNVKHKPGGGDIKIFDDKTYLRQVSGNNSEGRASGTQAYKNVSEFGARSAPGTPRQKSPIKVKKISTAEDYVGTPKINKMTKVVVTSGLPKTNDEIKSLPIEVTYSEISSSRIETVENAAKLIEMPTKHAPLKPTLSGILDGYEAGKLFNGSEDKLNFENIGDNKKVKTLDTYEQSFGSPNLFQTKLNKRDDLERSQVLQTQSLTQKKIGKISRERNALDNSNSPDIQLHDELTQPSVLSSQKIENYHRQFKFSNPDIKTDNPNLDLKQNFYSNQNFQSEKFPQNTSYSLKTPLHSSVPEERIISDLQKNQSRKISFE